MAHSFLFFTRHIDVDMDPRLSQECARALMTNPGKTGKVVIHDKYCEVRAAMPKSSCHELKVQRHLNTGMWRPEPAGCGPTHRYFSANPPIFHPNYPPTYPFAGTQGYAGPHGRSTLCPCPPGPIYSRNYSHTYDLPNHRAPGGTLPTPTTNDAPSRGKPDEGARPGDMDNPASVYEEVRENSIGERL